MAMANKKSSSRIWLVPLFTYVKDKADKYHSDDRGKAEATLHRERKGRRREWREKRSTDKETNTWLSSVSALRKSNKYTIGEISR